MGIRIVFSWTWYENSMKLIEILNSASLKNFSLGRTITAYMLGRLTMRVITVDIMIRVGVGTTLAHFTIMFVTNQNVGTLSITEMTQSYVGGYIPAAGRDLCGQGRLLILVTVRVPCRLAKAATSRRMLRWHCRQQRLLEWQTQWLSLSSPMNEWVGEEESLLPWTTWLLLAVDSMKRWPRMNAKKARE